MPFTSIRIGPATNSSSSHSVIFHTSESKIPREIIPDDVDYEYSCFYNESPYALTSPLEKFRWWMSSSSISDRISSWVLKNPDKTRMILGLSEGDDIFHRTDKSSDVNAYIFDNIAKQADIELAMNFMSDPLVVVYGGRDDGSFMETYLDHEEMGVFSLRGYTSLILIADKENRTVVGHFGSNGLKFRWAEYGVYEKSPFPELVDVKITDFCDYGCKFCYMGSTKEGVHAPLERIVAIAEFLKGKGVFEVALGGGEPTSHPDFPKILHAFASRGIRPNFTCYGTKWLENEDIVRAVCSIAKDMVVGIGVSVHVPKDIEKVDKIRPALVDFSKNRWINVKVIAQTVVGVTPFDTTKTLIETAISKRHSVLFLGYKPTGRGFGFRDKVTNFDAEYILRFAKENYLNRECSSLEEWPSDFTFSVDTAFVDAYGKELEKVGVDKVFISSPEGKFSMYIDAVTNKMGPSSYNVNLFEDLDIGENFTNKWMKW